MLRNYLLIAWRNLKRHKVFSFINALGLAIGMAACLFILQYVGFERSYDDFHSQGDRIYRIGVAWFYPNGTVEERGVGNFAAAGPAMKKELPEVEAFVRLRPWYGGTLIRSPQVESPQDRIYFADPTIFTVFSFPVLQGDAVKGLAEPHSVVLSETTARKYFGRQDPIGKIIELKQGNNQFSLTVKAVFKDIPTNSHLKFDVLLNYQWLGEWGETDWGWSNFITYVLLKPGTNGTTLSQKFPALLRKYRESTMANAQHEVQFIAQPLRDIHLYSDLRGEIEPTGNGKMVYFLTLIGGFILLIAYANYINLSTAQAINRAKEVGLRKVVGASRWVLIRQFLFESFLLNAIAIVLSFTFTQAFQGVFSRLAGLPAGVAPLDNTLGWLPVLICFLVGSLLSGLYPAFVLSSFKPIAVLKGKLARSTGGGRLREGLVVLQFTASVALIAGTLVVYQQLSFMRNQQLGVHIAQILIVKAPILTDSTHQGRVVGFKNALTTFPDIGRVTGSSSIPGEPIGWSFDNIQRKGIDPSQVSANYIIGVDYDFIKTYGLELLAGRDFDRRFGDDKRGFIINEEAAKLMGFSGPQAAIGQPMVWKERPDSEGFKIIGVVKNFHHLGLKNRYDPILLTLDHPMEAFYSCQVQAKDVSQTIAQIKQTYQSFFPGNPFEYFFLDEFFNQQYHADQRFGQVFGLFAGLAILVACMGLLGLSSFTISQRTKEIGIRKVLGASVANLLLLLSSGFLKLVLLANLIAWPLAYWSMHNWLNNYAFRIEITGWLFVLPGLLVLLLALLTVSFQTLKTASANPAKALRYE